MCSSNAIYGLMAWTILRCIEPNGSSILHFAGNTIFLKKKNLSNQMKCCSLQLICYVYALLFFSSDVMFEEILVLLFT